MGSSSVPGEEGTRMATRKQLVRIEKRRQVGTWLRRRQSRVRKVIESESCRSVVAKSQGPSRELDNLPQCERGHGRGAHSEEANACQRLPNGELPSQVLMRELIHELLGHSGDRALPFRDGMAPSGMEISSVPRESPSGGPSSRETLEERVHRRLASRHGGILQCAIVEAETPFALWMAVANTAGFPLSRQGACSSGCFLHGGG